MRLSSLAAITLFAAKAIARVTGRLLIHLGRWLLVGVSSLAAIAALNFAISIAEAWQWPLILKWLLAVLFCLIVGTICAVALGLLVQPGIAKGGLRWITGPLQIILEERPWILWRRPDRWKRGAASRRTDCEGGKRGTRDSGEEGRGVRVEVRDASTGEEASTSIKGPSNSATERQRFRQSLRAYFVKFVIALLAAIRALGRWLSRAGTPIAGPWNPPARFRWQRGLQLLLAQFVKFVRALVAATQALGQWLSPTSPIFKLMVLLLGLPTVPYSVVAPVIPHTEEIPSEPGQLPQEPKPSISLEKPFLFTQPKLVCPNHEFIAWPYYDVELHFSITSCSFKEGSSDPCKAKAIVVVGRASTGGAEEVESQRSLDRGNLLAHMLKRNLLQRCGNGTGIRWFVLNVGQYAGQTLKGRQVAQREVSVFIADGDADLDGIGNALEQFVENQPILSEYTRCDLHSLGDSPRKSSLVRRLRCGPSRRGSGGVLHRTEPHRPPISGN